jgi:type II pantothenate kinase
VQLGKLRVEPNAFGKLGVGDLFELREETLREFGFDDVYRWPALNLMEPTL